ncbi:MAG: DUF885 domain-containing protein [Chloroflexi bacterium]|nr:DUF885 domain-containing protein [Chloroflexota bacterium]
MPTFQERFANFLDEYLPLHPTVATSIGDHRYDDRWPDVSEAGRQVRLAFIDRWLTELRALPTADLATDDAVDRDLLVMELEAERFGETELRDETWDPLTWIYLIGDGIFTLIARDFAPLADRLTSVAGRLEGLPALLDGAKAALEGPGDGRPVGRFQTEKALEQLPGVAELTDDALAEAERAAPEDAAVAGVRDRLAAGATLARAALADFEAHLRDDVLPRSEGEGRLGPDLFARKMRHTMRSESMTAERVLTAAEGEFDAVRAELIRLARDLWPRWRRGAPLPGDDGAVVRGVLDAIAAEHPKAEDLLDFCRAETARIEAFCRDHDLIELAEDPLEIRWTPTFLRAFGGAMLIPPGPLDKGQKAFFAITPMPDEWPPERKESYLREDNARMLRLLTIHEAVPGHYLQGVYANRSESLARAIFWSGVFAEGWAVYVTQVMMDVGYGADDGALLLTHWKFYLRAVTNAVIDARIHTGGMTEDEAVALMVEGGFQEEAEARAKYDRARLSSTQLSTYFAGSMEMWDIELEARRRAATAAGADPSAIEPRGLPGGFGATPGFHYRPHLESVIAHGSPPTSLIRRILFG